MTVDKVDPRAMADRLVEAGADRADIASALAQLNEDETDLFLRRLAAHGAMRDLDEGPADGADHDEEVSEVVLARVQALYDAEKAEAMASARPKDLSVLATWVAAKAAFGNDVTFVIKLAGRHVTQPTLGFVRYAADALGVAFAEVRRHFADGMPRGVAGAEFKSSGKPGADGVEAFAEAVRAAKVPDELRARWLAE